MNTIDREQSVVAAVPKDLFIDGEWSPAESGRTFAVEDTATGKNLTHVAERRRARCDRRARRGGTRASRVGCASAA